MVISLFVPASKYVNSKRAKWLVCDYFRHEMVVVKIKPYLKKKNTMCKERRSFLSLSLSLSFSLFGTKDGVWKFTKNFVENYLEWHLTSFQSWRLMSDNARYRSARVKLNELSVTRGE